MDKKITANITYRLLGQKGKELLNMVPPGFPNEFSNVVRLVVDCVSRIRYTGLEDANGEPIFEGDILQYIAREERTKYIVSLWEGAFFIMDVDDPNCLVTGLCSALEMFPGNFYNNGQTPKQNANTQIIRKR